MIRRKGRRCKSSLMKTLKKSGEGAKTFIVTLPKAANQVVFTVTAEAQPPYLLGHNIFWLRAREIGTEAWGQTIWAEMEDRAEGLFVSRDINPSALWLVPETTYEIEVAPETLRVYDFDLGVRVTGWEMPKGKSREREVERVDKKESLLENPFFLMAVMAVVFAGYLWLSMWRK